MHALIDLFHSLSKILDKLVLEVDPKLPAAEDIHPAIHKASEYATDIARLPAKLAKLEAQKVSVETSVPARDATVRKTKHAVTLLEAKLKKLGESIDRNLRAASNEDPAPVAKTVSTGYGAHLPASRQDIIEGLRKEILAAEDVLAAARDIYKRAEAFRKGVATRTANLDKEIDAAKRAIVDHAGRLEETVKVLRKTISHLQNRQSKRDRKRENRKTATMPGFENTDGSPIEFEDVQLDPLPMSAPTDEDIRKLAEAQGLPINGPEDLEAARQLFLN